MSASSSLTTHTDPGLVGLSITIVIVGSYLALDLTRRSADAGGWQKRALVLGAGVTMGVGIWSMHFVGMLAVGMSMPVSYNGAFVVLSLLAAVFGASVSLAMVTRPHLSLRGLLSAAAFMGFAVTAMHYLGMASMQMPAVIHWHVGLVILSVGIGLVSSLVALSLLVRIRQSSDGFGFKRQLAAAALLGAGAAGLHYSAMQASTFTVAVGNHSAGQGFRTDTLVVMLALAAAVMFTVLVGGAAVDQRRAAIASDISVIATIARDLCRVGDSRTRICRAVQELTGADRVTLLEPDADGRHTITAATDRPDGLRSLSPGPAQIPWPRPTVPPSDLSQTAQTLAELTEVSDGACTVLCENLTLDGRHVGLLAVSWDGQARRLSDRTRTLLRMVAAEAAVAIDRENLLGRLEHLSRHDELTGLLNRRVFNEELDREFAVARDRERPLSLVMLDIDHFKDYNDAHGHQGGDRLLKRAAAAWRRQLRGSGLIARYGGEEFIVILPGCDSEEAVLMADRLREAIPGGVTCSAGVATLELRDSAADLIGRADLALYDAKALGRDRTRTLLTPDSMHDLLS